MAWLGLLYGLQLNWGQWECCLFCKLKREDGQIKWEGHNR